MVSGVLIRECSLYVGTNPCLRGDWIVRTYCVDGCPSCCRVLLDQLLQYEPLSGEEEEATDYSGSEDEVRSDTRLHRPAVSVAKMVSLVYPILWVP